MTEVRDFAIELEVDAIEARTRAVVTEHLVARWRAQRDGLVTPPSPASLADEQLWRRLTQWRRGLATGLLGRRVDQLWRLYGEAIVAGDVDVDAAAAGEGRGAVEAAVAAHNRVARRLGWRDYYALSLAHAALDPATVGRCIATSERASRGPWQRARGAAPTPEETLPVPSLRVLVDHIGIAIDARLRVDRSADCGARAYVVDPGAGDIRLLVGTEPSLAGWRELAHEIGHAWYASSLDPGLSWSLAIAAAPCLDEGVAECFAAVVDGVDFLVEGLGMSAARARAVSAARRRARWGWRRWQLARTDFERDLYEDPHCDLERRWRELLLRYLGAGDYPPWHSVAHLRSNAGSQASYLVGDELCRRLLQPRGCGSEVGSTMATELLRPGASREWRSLVRSYTQCEV